MGQGRGTLIRPENGGPWKDGNKEILSRMRDVYLSKELRVYTKAVSTRGQVRKQIKIKIIIRVKLLVL